MSWEVKESTPIDLGEIQGFEKKIGKNLPTNYKAFLVKYGGGYPIPDCFQFSDGSNGSIVDRFLGLNNGKHSNLEKYFETYKNRIPENFIPIAHDPGGNLILLSLCSDSKGKIFFWDHEREAADGSSPDLSNISHISDSLDLFLSMLSEYQEEE